MHLIGFLLRATNPELRDKVRSYGICKALNVEPLQVERSQLPWFGYVTRIPKGRSATQVLLVTPTGKRPIVRPRTRWSDYISDRAWSRLDAEPAKLSKIAVDRDVLRVLRLLTPRPSQRKSRLEDELITNAIGFKNSNRNEFLNLNTE